MPRFHNFGFFGLKNAKFSLQIPEKNFKNNKNKE